MAIARIVDVKFVLTLKVMVIFRFS